MDEFLEVRRQVIKNYVPKKDESTTSDRLKEVRDIATEIYEQVKLTFLQQAADPNQPFLYFEFRNSNRFSSYDSEYIRGYPTTKILVMLVLEEMCKEKEIKFLHEDSRVEGGLNWKFIKILPIYISGKQLIK